MTISSGVHPAVLIWLSIVPVVGCTTTGGSDTAQMRGMEQTYDSSFPTVWYAIPWTVEDLGLTLVASYRDGGVVVAKRGFSFGSYGEKVAIVVRPVTASMTTVEVVSKKEEIFNITARNWEKPFHKTLARTIDAPPSGATEPPLEWDERYNSAGVSLTLEETGRGASGKTVFYKITSSGFSIEASPTLYSSQGGGSSAVELDVTILPSGVVIIGGSTEDDLAITGYVPGQPLAFALVSGAKRAYARTVPHPIMAHGTGGCWASVELVDKSGAIFVVRFGGFQPDETVLIRKQFRGHSRFREYRASERGEVLVPVLFEDDDHGAATAIAEGASGVVTVQYGVGRDAL